MLCLDTSTIVSSLDGRRINAAQVRSYYGHSFQVVRDNWVSLRRYSLPVSARPRPGPPPRMSKCDTPFLTVSASTLLCEPRLSRTFPSLLLCAARAHQ